MTTNVFIAGRGALYHFDPRAKLLLVLLLSALLFFPSATIGAWILVLLLFIICWYATSFKQTLQMIKPLLFILTVMLLITPLTYRNGEALIVFRSMPIVTVEALENLSRLTSRFLSISFLFTLFMWTTPMADITLTLQWYGLSYKGALVMTLAFRFIPFIADSFQKIEQSHSLRVESSSRRKRGIKDLIPTVTAALVVALKSIPLLAMSLEHRGFGREEKRGAYRLLERRATLLGHLALSLLCSTLFFVLNTIL